jgi:hypothetical protein
MMVIYIIGLLIAGGSIAVGIIELIKNNYN